MNSLHHTITDTIIYIYTYITINIYSVTRKTEQRYFQVGQSYKIVDPSFNAFHKSKEMVLILSPISKLNKNSPYYIYNSLIVTNSQLL